MLAAATVLAVALPGVEASPEPTKLNIKNLIPESYREKYQRKILDVSQQAQKAAEAKAAVELEHRRQLERERVVEAPKRVVQGAQASDCYTAMRATWPQSLWAGATIVMQHESSAVSNKIGPILPNGTVGFNSDGSQDFGCFQINNFAHPGFFANSTWSDPYQNAAYAYRLYTGRGNWQDWMAVKGILW